MIKLRLYQTEAIEDMLNKKRVLIADDMGLGKCAEAIGAKVAIDKKYGYIGGTLIVSPADVIPHWEEEIKVWYRFKENPRIKKIETSSFDEDVKDVHDYDFALIGYPTLSYLGNFPQKISKLEGFKYGIIDEAHNAKNPDSIRSKGVKKIFDSSEYLAILTGTPVPNTVVDLYMLLSLLDKEQFPVVSDNPKAILSFFYQMFRQDPEFVRRVLNDRMIRREIGQGYLGGHIPKLIYDPLNVVLDGEHKEVYLEIYEDDNLPPHLKLMELIKASIDPNLIRGKRNRVIESSVYSSLDKLVESAIEQKGKILIFSDLKEGVIRTLEKRYQKYGALVLDGDVDAKKMKNGIGQREEIRRRFQRDSNHKVLISNVIMSEGVDLTAATDVIHLTLPYTPAMVDQRNRRSQRFGEIEKSELRFHFVRPYINEFIPVITEGIERLIDDKRRIIEFLMKQPFSVTKQDLDEIKNGEVHSSMTLSPFILNPTRSILSHFGQLKGKGAINIKNHYLRYPREAQHIAKLYASHWEGYYGGNTANLYKKIVKILDENGDLSKKLDIASGPFSLSRILNQPVINIDLNQYMLKAGKLLEENEQIVGGNKAITANFTYLPFRNGCFDLVMNSLALHMSTNRTSKKAPISERELALREMNRVLKIGGYGLITLPHSVISETDSFKFHSSLEKLGFQVLSFSGFYTGPEKSDFKVYLAGLKKLECAQKENLEFDELEWKMDVKHVRKSSSKLKRKPIVDEKPEVKKVFINEFFLTRSRKTLEEEVLEGLNGKS